MKQSDKKLKNHRRRRGWRTVAKSHFKSMDHLRGQGPFALVTLCGVPVFSLHATYEQAEKARVALQTTPCGNRCFPLTRHKSHYIVDLQKALPHAA